MPARRPGGRRGRDPRSHDPRIGLRTGQGFLNYDGMDVPAYQRERLAAFVAMLKHMGMLPEPK